MKIGYARVSTQDQDNTAQIAALKLAGCERIFEEKISGGRWDRPEFQRMLDQLRAGDVVVVYKLDRLSRSLKDLLHVLEKLEAVGVSFVSLSESIDTSSAAGRMMMHILGSFAEFERAMLRERTLTGLNSARKAGRIGGRRPKLSELQQRSIVESVTSGQQTAADAARLFGVHASTVGRLLAKASGQESQRGVAVKEYE